MMMFVLSGCLLFYRQKQGTTHGDSILIQGLPNGLALEFERSDATRRLRLVLSEILFINSQVSFSVRISNKKSVTCKLLFVRSN